MSTPLPLKGITVAVTRPQAQADELVGLIESAGGRALRLPFFEIEPLIDEYEFRRVAESLVDTALAIFVSPNAVEIALPALLQYASWPLGLAAVCPGSGSARALAAFSINKIVLPSVRYDAEAMLDLPEMSEEAVRGRKVLLFCGEGGRPLLAETMRARGAIVDVLFCYRRLSVPGVTDQLLNYWRKGQLDALVVTSSEGLRLLWAEKNKEFMCFMAEIPLFIPHARIAELAASLGLRHIVHTSTDNPGLLAGLCAYNWP